jgi:hypothetical protein
LSASGRDRDQRTARPELLVGFGELLPVRRSYKQARLRSRSLPPPKPPVIAAADPLLVAMRRPHALWLRAPFLHVDDALLCRSSSTTPQLVRRLLDGIAAREQHQRAVGIAAVEQVVPVRRIAPAPKKRGVFRSIARASLKVRASRNRRLPSSSCSSQWVPSATQLRAAVERLGQATFLARPSCGLLS